MESFEKKKFWGEKHNKLPRLFTDRLIEEVRVDLRTPLLEVVEEEDGDWEKHHHGDRQDDHQASVNSHRVEEAPSPASRW